VVLDNLAEWTESGRLFYKLELKLINWMDYAIQIIYHERARCNKLPNSFSSQNVEGDEGISEKMERNLVSDVAQIYKMWIEYAAAINDGDINRWISLWIDDGIQMPPDVPRSVGVPQIRGSIEPIFEIINFENFHINTDEVHILGDQAYTHGLFFTSMTPKNGGETIDVTGKFLTILTKQADGFWKIAVDCFNSNSPGELLLPCSEKRLTTGKEVI